MSKKLMIVDDSRVVCANITHILEDTDWEVVSYCRSGEEAIAAYAECQPDAVTMDIVMPGMDGLETGKKLLAQWPDANILYISSLAYDEMVEQAQDLGGKDFIFKPIQGEELIEKLSKLLP